MVGPFQFRGEDSGGRYRVNYNIFQGILGNAKRNASVKTELHVCLFVCLSVSHAVTETGGWNSREEEAIYIGRHFCLISVVLSF